MGVKAKNTSLTVIIWLLAFSCCGPLAAVEAEPLLSGYVMTQWGIDKGFPCEVFSDVVQTGDGYMWFATPKGLVRSDGVSFRIISYAKDLELENQKELFPDRLLIDGSGNLWIGGAGHLTKYDCQTGHFQHFTRKDGLTGHRFSCMIKDAKGNLWLGFAVSYVNRLWRDNLNEPTFKFTPFNESDGLAGKKICTIFEDHRGEIVVATRESGIFIFRNNTFVKYDLHHLDKGYLIHHMMEDSRGLWWIATNKGLLQVRNGSSEIEPEEQLLDTQDGLTNPCILGLMEDANHSLWIGTLSSLHILKNPVTATPHLFQFETLLPNHGISRLYQDNERGIWLNAGNSGPWHLKQSAFSTVEPSYLNEKEPGETVFSLYMNNKGDIWLGTRGRLFKTRNDQCLEKIDIPKAQNISITAIHESVNGNLWIGTEGRGVFMRPKGGKKLVQFTTADGLADNLLISIFEDSRGKLWFGTYDGVSRFADQRFESLKSKQGIKGKFINNVYETKQHDIWIASNKGLYILKDGDFQPENRVHYLPEIPVTCIIEDNDTLWIATHGAGLKKFKDGSFTSFTTNEGMESNFIYQMMEDLQGNLWIASDSGLLRIRKNPPEETQDTPQVNNHIDCTAFGLADGIRSTTFINIFSRHSALKKNEGQFWFVTSKGIIEVQPGEIKMDKSPPYVLIETIMVDAHLFPLPQGKREPMVFNSIHYLVFYFSAPTFQSPEKMKFKYRLEGYDREWQFLPPNARRKAVYKDMPFGSYTFRVIAANGDGVWNRTGDKLEIQLKPAICETIILRYVVAILVIGLGLTGYLLYKRRPVSREAKYKSSPLPPEFVEECLKKLAYLMDIQLLYRQEDISLQSLAEKMSISPHQLSRILNEKLNKTFPDLVNTYRIEAVKKILSNPKEKDRKILEIAYDVGFNTKAAFNNAFRKYTGMTPSQYRDKAMKSVI